MVRSTVTARDAGDPASKPALCKQWSESRDYPMDSGMSPQRKCSLMLTFALKNISTCGANRPWPTEDAAQASPFQVIRAA